MLLLQLFCVPLPLSLNEDAQLLLPPIVFSVLLTTFSILPQDVCVQLPLLPNAFFPFPLQCALVLLILLTYVILLQYVASQLVQQQFFPIQPSRQLFVRLIVQLFVTLQGQFFLFLLSLPIF